jgi:hypothetical protein
VRFAELHWARTLPVDLQGVLCCRDVLLPNGYWDLGNQLRYCYLTFIALLLHLVQEVYARGHTFGDT